jgi:hypothetical protein
MAFLLFPCSAHCIISRGWRTLKRNNRAMVIPAERPWWHGQVIGWDVVDWNTES